MTIGSIIQRIQSQYSRGVESVDSRLTPEHIWDKILSSRAYLLRIMSNEKKSISESCYITIPKIELEKVIFENQGCSYYKSKKKFPNVITDINQSLTQYVTSITGDIEFSKTNWDSLKYSSGSKYTSQMPKYFIRNEYIYITGKDNPKFITVKALFEDPLEVYELYNLYTNNSCESYMEKTFPFDEALKERLVEFCLKELVQFFSKTVEDATTNSRDNTFNNTK